MHVLLARYREQAKPGSSPAHVDLGPHRPPRPDDPARILHLRDALTYAGLDAGAESIHARLQRAGCPHQPLHDLAHPSRPRHVTPQPQKRPRSSIIRFEAAQPNETWQSDFAHWLLADRTDTEIISWLDDHSRYLLHISAHPRITGPTVVTTFTHTADPHGLPASTLTDNGMVYTTHFARSSSGPNGFERLLTQLGITQKNGSPSHPQTQGKIERFHQTLKRGTRPTRPDHHR